MLSQLALGGINISIEQELQPDLSYSRHSYSEFWTKTNDISDSDILISIEKNYPGDFTGEPVFSTGSAWHLIRQNDYFLLTWGESEEDYRSGWIARINQNFSRVQLFLNRGNSDSDLVAAHHIQYPLDQIIFYHHLLYRSGLLVHSAGGMVGKKCMLFPGVSGAGKSTLSRLISGHDSVNLFSDDRNIVRLIDGRWQLFGTPWAGDANIAKNNSAELDGILFLSQAQENKITPLDHASAVKRLLPVSSIPWYSKKDVNLALNLCDKLIVDTSAYLLEFTNRHEVIELLVDFQL